ncbi:hypothetical protein, partial [Domibacillus mangrovi]|uniref:hypothetical protein n=1 Tax=Domibacillus mangrovi TaxID=1714354 RepID=UPI000AA47D9C
MKPPIQLDAIVINVLPLLLSPLSSWLLSSFSTDVRLLPPSVPSSGTGAPSIRLDDSGASSGLGAPSIGLDDSGASSGLAAPSIGLDDSGASSGLGAPSIVQEETWAYKQEGAARSYGDNYVKKKG